MAQSHGYIASSFAPSFSNCPVCDRLACTAQTSSRKHGTNAPAASTTRLSDPPFTNPFRGPLTNLEAFDWKIARLGSLQRLHFSQLNVLPDACRRVTVRLRRHTRELLVGIVRQAAYKCNRELRMLGVDAEFGIKHCCRHGPSITKRRNIHCDDDLCSRAGRRLMSFGARKKKAG